LAEVHLGVDDARKDMQTAGVDHLRGRRLPQIAQRRDAPAMDPDVAHALAIVVDDGRPLQNEVETLGHSASAACFPLLVRIRKTDARCNRSGERWPTRE